ncbi:unnamed protein product [Ceratitis capitata]|uniref:(Mediterranean fruit fly) hypothetical protein n=1 Tax=Ceratitis capitata TaxID=7213 RepID=A0A811UZS6_CERCA|nr:unnamed protein product [Ceratitis capitata]
MNQTTTKQHPPTTAAQQSHLLCVKRKKSIENRNSVLAFVTEQFSSTAPHFTTPRRAAPRSLFLSFPRPYCHLPARRRLQRSQLRFTYNSLLNAGTHCIRALHPLPRRKLRHDFRHLFCRSGCSSLSQSPCHSAFVYATLSACMGWLALCHNDHNNDRLSITQGHGIV